MIKFTQNIVEKLISGGIGVIPTDTLYGLVGRADMPETVERIYAVRKRSSNKSCIILISSTDDLKKFDIEVPAEIQNFLAAHWPGKISIIIGSKAFRVPDLPELRELLLQTGPLIAPSANFEGEPTATNIEAAKAVFSDSVDFYVDGGELSGQPSTLIKFENGQPIVLREGAVKIF